MIMTSFSGLERAPTSSSILNWEDMSRPAPAVVDMLLRGSLLHQTLGSPWRSEPQEGEHMYCNTQLYGLGGYHRPRGSGVPRAGVDSTENYQFPWTSNFCEKRGRSGVRVCGTTYQEHLGQDCRPPRPTSRPHYWVTAVDAGVVTRKGRSHLISVSNQRYIWTYLHTTNRAVRRGERVRKGQRLGQVWNKTNTSIHLHIELRVKGANGVRVLDPLPSLIVAYRKALGDDGRSLLTADDTLRLDRSYEIAQGTGRSSPPEAPRPSSDEAPCSRALKQQSIGTDQSYTFSSLWCHNGSVMGLAVSENRHRFIYYKPRAAIRDSVKDEPVLLDATVQGSNWVGRSMWYSTACGNRRFEVSGTLSADGKVVSVNGERDSFQNRNCDSVKVPERLVFTRLAVPSSDRIAQGTGRPSTDETPRPSTDVAPRPSTDVAPRPSTDVAPRPPTDVASRPPTDVAPRPPTDVAPRPPTDVAPRPPTDVAPRPPADVAPRPPADVAPRPPADESLCSQALEQQGIGTDQSYFFRSLWCHNGSVMGLVVSENRHRFIYYKPRAAIRDSIKDNPVLLDATVEGSNWVGKSMWYSTACGNRLFEVSGALSDDGKVVSVVGERDSFQNGQCDSFKVTETLSFTRMPVPSTEGPSPNNATNRRQLTPDQKRILELERMLRQAIVAKKVSEEQLRLQLQETRGELRMMRKRFDKHKTE